MLTRLEFDDLSPELQELLAPRVARLGYFGDYFRVASQQPEAVQLGLALMDALKRDLAPRIVEVVALTQAAWFENAYERVQHERLAEKLGFGRAWIAGVLWLEPQTAPALDETERLVQQLVLAVLASGGRDADESIAAVRRALGERATIALLLLIGKYAGDSLFMNAAKLTLPVDSIFTEQPA